MLHGKEVDCTPLPFGDNFLKNVDYITLLGSHLTNDASTREEMKLHMQKRYKSVQQSCASTS